MYQMGKVGSSAIEAAIPGSVQIHDFYFTPPCYVHRSLAYPAPWRYAAHRCSLVMRRALVKAKREEKKIITLVRNPLERNISMFFQSLPYWLIEYQTGIVSGRVGVGARVEGVDFLHDCFERIFPHSYPAEWFDKEMKRLTGIDIFDEEYDRSIGTCRVSCGGWDLLLIEMSKLTDSTDVISDFLGRKVEIVSTNRGEEKWYMDAYSAFKHTYKPSAAVSSAVYETKYFEHFYGSDDNRSRVEKLS